MLSVILWSTRAILASLLTLVPTTLAATADEWRTRSIYQIITDRYALPAGSDLNSCNPGDQTWCGGTWATIKDNLDYIQNAGFTAIWISPINQNYQGPRTPYGDPYHGYWMADVSKLNDRFGTEDDLKALIAELHKRDMYIMVDVVVNNVMSLSANPDYSTYMFTEASQYHPYCPIVWGNITSEQTCWLGDTNVYLPDLDTSNPQVISGYQSWIKDMVSKYNIDGLRIDAAKHVGKAFWPGFCGAAGVFCIGEVFDGIDGVDEVSSYQGPDALDSVLNFPMWAALVQAFGIPGPGNMSALTSTLSYSRTKFADMTLLGNFIENQDVNRWANVSVDPQTMYSVMVWTFMMDGIPIVYYGQEQGFHGNADPYNREPLWSSDYKLTAAYNLTASLNQFRNHLVKTTTWAIEQATILTESPTGVAFIKGDVITVLTNIGSPPQNNTHIAVQSPYPPKTPMIDVIACKQFVVASDGMLQVEYGEGGRPVVLALESTLQGTNICSNMITTTSGGMVGGSAGSLSGNAAKALSGENRWRWMWLWVGAILALVLS